MDMSRLFKQLGSSLLALALSGCALFQPHPDPASQRAGETAPPASAVNPQLMRLLSYYQEISLQADASIEQEWKFYQAALVDGHCDTARMRLGLVLLRASERGLALKRDENLLHACMHDSDQGSGIPLLAQLVQAQLLHRTDTQAQHHEIARTVENLKKENQELRRQVDGLKAIERSLQNRRHLE
jgi:hypothetical protein